MAYIKPKELPDDTVSKEEDKVAAAYENISKKLEKIRGGKTTDEDSGDLSSGDPAEEEGLEEWKGPEGVPHSTGSGKGKEGEAEDEEEDEDEAELRKVKLRNLEDPEESEDDEEVEQMEAKKDWEPKEDDPLDEDEDGPEHPESSDESEAAEGEPRQGRDSDTPESRNVRKPEKDFSDESEKTENLEHRYSEPSGLSEKPISPEPDTLDDLTEEEKGNDFDIPNLKAARHENHNIGYNTDPQTKAFVRENKSSMETSDPNNFFSQANLPPKRANKFHLLILVAIGIAVISFTVYILKGGFGDINIASKPSPSPVLEPSPEPTPTPTPEPERAKYKVRVLNGSGKTGLAKTVSDKLKELGYQVEKTGNATNSAFLQTVVRVKAAAEPFIPPVVKDLAPEFDSAGNTSLKDSDTADIEVILGAK